MTVIEIILCGIIAGLIGALGMNLFLRWVSASFNEPVNMVKVLGSYFTKSETNAAAIGTALHLLFGSFFGILYTWILLSMGAEFLPNALFSGLGFGFAHGLISSYALMFIMSETHPIEKYRKVTFSIGVLYLIAHAIYGAFLGIAVGISAALLMG